MNSSGVLSVTDGAIAAPTWVSLDTIFWSSFGHVLLAMALGAALFVFVFWFWIACVEWGNKRRSRKQREAIASSELRNMVHQMVEHNRDRDERIKRLAEKTDYQYGLEIRDLKAGIVEMKNASRANMRYLEGLIAAQSAEIARLKVGKSK